VFVPGTSLVHLDDDEACGQSRGAHDMEEEMRKCAGAFLVGRVGWLEDESGLYGEQEAGGVEKLDVGISTKLGLSLGRM
jgi:hypothetical protein